jgi:hypothetical protein
MAIMALNQQRTQVDEDIVERAIALCNWQLGVRKLYDPVCADGVVAKLEGKIRNQLEARGPMNQRELRQRTNADRSGLFYFKNALKNLQQAGDILFENKSKTFYIRP